MKPPSLIPLLYMLLVDGIVGYARGSMRCICTTNACQDGNVAVCTAAHMCYTQIHRLPVDAANQRARRVTRRSGLYVTRVTRGCIDNLTPLLCENKPPQMDGTDKVGVAWPLLHCCRGDWCNKDTLPTRRPTATRASRTTTSPQSTSSTDAAATRYHANGGVNSERENDRHESDERRGQWRTINPLYVGVPIAGACVLLALAIFVIYILRCRAARHERNYHGCSDQLVVKVPPPSQPPPPQCRRGNGAAVTSAAARDKRSSENSERSPSGSETKLLTKT